MKAIFEFDAPESCVVCPLGHGNPCGKGTYCAACKQVFSDSYSKQNECAPFCQLKIISEDAPTVDAVPVVHGEWLPIKDDYGHLYQGQCSRCGCEPLRNPFHSPWRFCPNCGANNGAKMEREGK